MPVFASCKVRLEFAPMTWPVLLAIVPGVGRMLPLCLRPTCPNERRTENCARKTAVHMDLRPYHVESPFCHALLLTCRFSWGNHWDHWAGHAQAGEDPLSKPIRGVRHKISTVSCFGGSFIYPSGTYSHSQFF